MSRLVTASMGDPLVKLAITASIPVCDIHLALRNALVNKTDFVDELLVLAPRYELRLYAAFAANASIGFVANIRSEDLIIDTSDKAFSVKRLPFVMYRQGITDSLLLAAPAPRQLRHLLTQSLDPKLLPRLRVATPTELNLAAEIHLRDQRVHDAVHSYATQHPEHSSKVTLLGWQGWFFGFLFGFFPALLFLYPYNTLVALHVFAWFFFFSCVALRLLAVFSNRDPAEKDFHQIQSAGLPNYAVMVALYKEANVVAQLVNSLNNINWPATKIRFYLICEECDDETYTTLEKMELPANFQLIKVPDYGPKTKPKALMYALPLVEAEYLVLYDAEDRPHPDQLLEAYETFNTFGSSTACVQAPLEITNSGHSILTALFAFEYNALFRGLLPFLSRHNLFIPLGGTSNHFRLKVLRDIGGWDPFNVTEDADLGLRLHRYGYRTKVISKPTLEDAPEELMIWIKQRTRWFKGHMQTWMISLRNPRVLITEIGWSSFLVSQIMLGGIIVSALVHPILLLSIGYMASLYFLGASSPTITTPLALLDFINVALGYFAFMLLGYVSLRPDEKPGVWKRLISIPPYWVMLSFAAWRALFQIVHSPHKWEKTPHQPTPIIQAP